MNITFRQLQLFLALAETGSVGGAAKANHVTQPTASMQLKDITEAVGVPLYEVISKRVHLTQAGQELARTARAISGEWESFIQAVDGIKGLTRGKLNVAVVSTAKYFIPRLLGDFCKRYPDIDISLEILNRDGVVSRLRNNMDDLYIMTKPPHDMDLHCRAFLPNPLVVIANAQHLLVDRKKITLKELNNERFILRERGSGTRMAVDAHFKLYGFNPNLRLELGSNEAIKEAVAGGLGIAVLSEHTLRPHLATSAVAILPVENFPIESNWQIVHQKGKQLSPIATVFEQHLLSQTQR
ncbi:MAG: LysR family transcriptional regulator [Burkholderiales bacterium]|nr:LysR family transcriptional regulator [Burkholderiales bacterium]